MEISTEDGGDLRLKCFDIIPQFLLNNYLLKKVKLREDVYLVNNYDCINKLNIDLTELIDEEWEQAYGVVLQNLDIINHKKVNAYTLWTDIWSVYFKIGKVNITNKDNINSNNYLKHKYKAQTANLCVTGNTKVLTKDYGYIDIEKVAGQTLECWNGEEWSLTPLFKTSDNENVLKVTLSNGQVIEATPYHKWYVLNDNEYQEVRTYELNKDDKLIKFKLPDEPFREVGKYSIGFWSSYGSELSNEHIKVISVVDKNKTCATYCGTEPLRNKLMFNGVLTGNCLESFSINTEELSHTCNLLSINLAILVKLSIEEFKRSVRNAVDILDKTIDLAEFPIETAKASAYALRNTGIGIIGGADWLAYKNMTYNTKGIKELERVMEMIAYYSYERSIELAELKGAYPLFKEAKYDKMFNKTPEELNEASLNGFDWVSLHQRILNKGIRNFLLLSPAPNAGTGVVMGCSPNFMPVTSTCHFKDMKKSTPIIIPPYADEKGLLYRAKGSFNGTFFLDLTVAIQNWTDTGVSNEIGINPELFSMVEFSDKAIEYFLAKKLKAIYYMAETSCTSCAN